MQHAGAEFHNVAELREVDAAAGLRMQRVPEDVRRTLNSKAAQRMLSPDGAEIRFVCDSDSVEVTLSSPASASELIAFWGGFQDVERHVIGREATTIKLAYPERLARLKPDAAKNHPFSPRVWRLTIRGADKHGIAHFHELSARGLRPPRAGEIPAQTYLAYGTSITDGFSASTMHLSFVHQTARRLGMDAVNLGSAGSAYCEPQLADYIARRRDWHVATLCLSANMIGAEFSVEEFRQRASYMVNTIAAADPSRKVFCITVLPYFSDFCDGVEVGGHGKGLAPLYRQALREIVRQSPHGNVRLIEGSDLITDITGYTADLIHPGDYGMIQIAENLARNMQCAR